MGIKYLSFKKRGIDVSEFNGVINWDKVLNTDFAAVRVGYGLTIESQFKANWKAAKGKVKRIPYWYMDYYSNWYNPKSPAYNMSDAMWGKTQAELCWSAIKDDFEGIVFLDIESGGKSYSTPLNDPVTQGHAEIIARSFLEEIDRLTKKTNGIYCSIGWLSWFYSWFRNRPLWVAWYNETVNADDVVYSVKQFKWTGPVLMWQYTSDGDMDDNGSGDGISMGMQYNFLDLNGVIDEVKFDALFGEITTPDDETVIIPPVTERMIQVKEVIRTVTLRGKTEVSWTTKIKLLPVGTKLDCLEKVVVGGNTWQRVGIDQYVADIYDGTTYLK